MPPRTRWESTQTARGRVGRASIDKASRRVRSARCVGEPGLRAAEPATDAPFCIAELGSEAAEPGGATVAEVGELSDAVAKPSRTHVTQLHRVKLVGVGEPRTSAANVAVLRADIVELCRRAIAGVARQGSQVARHTPLRVTVLRAHLGQPAVHALHDIADCDIYRAL